MNGAFTLDEITLHMARMEKTNGLLMSLKSEKFLRFVLFAFTYMYYDNKQQSQAQYDGCKMHMTL